MNNDRKIIARALHNALSGKGAHVETGEIFEGLDWKVAGARPEGVSHSVYQLLNHMIYWQDWVVNWLDGKNPSVPRHASGTWPGDAIPTGKADWQAAVRHFREGLSDLRRRLAGEELLSKQGRKTRLEMLQTIASHNSYHSGQVVLLRQMLGTWPPQSGGLTW